MQRPRVLVLTGYGINCEHETAYAFNLPSVGGEARLVHIGDLLPSRSSSSSFTFWSFQAVLPLAMISPLALCWPPSCAIVWNGP